MDGFYSIYFTGLTGYGMGMLVLKDGAISGADAGGAIYDGSFQIDQSGRLIGAVTLTVPAGVGLVTGAPAGHEPTAFTIPLNLSNDFGNGLPVLVDTPTGTVNVIFKKIKNL